MKEKLLRVKGKNFTAGAVFVKERGEWRVAESAPILKKILGGKPLKDIPKILTKKGCTWEWMESNNKTAIHIIQKVEGEILQELLAMNDIGPQQIKETYRAWSTWRNAHLYLSDREGYEQKKKEFARLKKLSVPQKSVPGHEAKNHS